MCWLSLISYIWGCLTTLYIPMRVSEKILKVPDINFADSCFAARMGDHWISIDARLIILRIWDLFTDLHFYPFSPSRTGVIWDASHMKGGKHTFYWCKILHLPYYFAPQVHVRLPHLPIFCVNLVRTIVI